MSKVQERKSKPTKTWKYGIFKVQAYTCDNCKTEYRQCYGKNGKHSFTIKLQKGKGYIKA